MNFDNITKIIVALIGSLGLIIAAYFTYLSVIGTVSPSGRASEDIGTIDTTIAAIELASVSTQTDRYNDWILIGEDNYANLTNWYIGSVETEDLPKFSTNILNGKYRWSLGFIQVWERYLTSPYPMETDMYVAIDMNYVYFDTSATSAGIQFGIQDSTDFMFKLHAQGYFILNWFNGNTTETLVDWTKLTVDVYDVNKLSVSTNGSIISLYVNDVLVKTYKDNRYLGGKVGLVASSWGVNNVVVDFDNFEYKRKQ